MNKKEFLDTLREALSGSMQEGKTAAHIRYYQDYIDRQIRNGRSEKEVLDELGDPRLIAKTLLDTDGDTKAYGEYEESTWYGKALVIFLAALVILALLVIAGVLIPIFLVVAAVAFILSILRKS